MISFLLLIYATCTIFYGGFFESLIPENSERIKRIFKELNFK